MFKKYNKESLWDRTSVLNREVSFIQSVCARVVPLLCTYDNVPNLRVVSVAHVKNQKENAECDSNQEVDDPKTKRREAAVGDGY